MRLPRWLRRLACAALEHDFPDDAAQFARSPLRHTLTVNCKRCGTPFPVSAAIRLVPRRG